MSNSPRENGFVKRNGKGAWHAAIRAQASSASPKLRRGASSDFHGSSRVSTLLFHGVLRTEIHKPTFLNTKAKSQATKIKASNAAQPE
ncbi:hypothetical protein SKAU_G00343910 [Synaphobranchus kaupii]|uniref:Uncharacterized protein n=1 Tax=Synaphobranchus kaupii TaxID=118154 RepID=A0A9Q1EJ49_SYNKA|nr:hypothetical protein SKAU_G00343910 [Synaphobranchus kaupii]